MNHPWSDLTDDELKEMVEFCREYFSYYIYEGGEGYQRGIRVKKSKWKWKKGDWCFYLGSVELITAEHLAIEIPHESIPLPLAHQWLPLIAKSFGPYEIQYKVINLAWDSYDGYGIEITDPRYDAWVGPDHANSHFACYLAFRKVIEDEAP